MDELQQNFIGQFDATQNIMQTVQTNKKESDIWNEYFSAQVHYEAQRNIVGFESISTAATIADKMLEAYNKRFGEAHESK